MFMASKVSPTLFAVLEAFKAQGAVIAGGQDNFYTACPCHDDGKASLSIADGEDRVLFKCHAGCDQAEMFKAVVEFTGLSKSDFFFKKTGAAKAEGPLATISGLAQAKRLPVELLAWAGMRDGPMGIHIPYWDGSGPPRERIRPGLSAKHCLWGDKPYAGHEITAYGAWLLPAFRTGNVLFLVEGETDSLTGWRHHLPVLGIPGKGMARSVIANNPHLLHGIHYIFVIEEPDDYEQRMFLKGVRRGISDIHFSFQVFPMRLPEKDLSDLHVKRGPEGFWPAFHEAWAAAVDAPNWPDPLPIPPIAATVCAIVTAPGLPEIFQVRDIHRRDRDLSSAKIRSDLALLEQAKIVRELAPPKALGRPARRYRTNPKMRL